MKPVFSGHLKIFFRMHFYYIVGLVWDYRLLLKVCFPIKSNSMWYRQLLISFMN